MPFRFILALVLFLPAACAAPIVVGPRPGPAVAPVPVVQPARLLPGIAAQTFVEVVDRVEPVAESVCRAQAEPGTNCNFVIVVDDTRGREPNAFQTVAPDGRPVVGFTLALIADARNADELAFVLGHETAHHIAGHITRQQRSSLSGAVLAGVLATAGGGDAAAVRNAQNMGAQVGARRYAKEYELEADALGARIAVRAGYDPVRGAAFFTRIPDPGDQFLGTHPPNADRIKVVRAAVGR
jgi:predicted Zn-dependent protease